MDIIILLAAYLILLVVGVLCILYRDSAILCTGPIGTLREIITESVSRVVPRILQSITFQLCRFLLYERTCVFQVIFVVLVLLGHAVWVVDMLPILYQHYPNHNHTFWPFVFIFLNFFCWHKAWIGLYIQHTGDPGEITAKNHSVYQQVYCYDGVLYDGKKKCSTCKFIKPARSKHCGICNRCVHKFDHHCIWTNNCVGGLNQRYFLLFMFTLLAVFIQGIYVGGGCVLNYAYDVKLFQASYIDDDGSVKAITASVAFQHLFFALPRLVFLVVALAVLTVLLGVFFIHHIYLLFTNQTTNERYKLQELDAAFDAEQDDNKDIEQEYSTNPKTYIRGHAYQPYSNGVFSNVLEVFLPFDYIDSTIKKQ